MIEMKYYKDFRHNYLILKEDMLPVNGYQSKMITENRIKGLLSCKERHIDGEQLFYYDITSKQSLASLYEYAYIDLATVRAIFRRLKIASEEMAGYLLTENCLVLKPEFVFCDMEKSEWSFLYFPYETEENDMLSFVEYLTDKMNVEDKEGIEVCYKMLQLIEKEQFVLDEVIQWLEEDSDRDVMYQTNVVKTEGKSDGAEIAESSYIYEEDDYDIAAKEKENKALPEKTVFEAGRKVAIGALFIMVLAAALLYYVYITRTLTQRGQIFFFVAVIGVIVFSFVSLVYLLLDKMMLARGYSVLGTLAKGEWESGKEKRYRETDIYETDAIGEKKTTECGNTIFIPWVENCENKLYGMGKGNKHHIDLNRLPLTVGKLAGSVDMVIADSSLSRRHVKFSREGGRICMTDLNSTNGTFLNGLRLEPNGTEMLEPGDEIRLGKLKFIYR